MSLAEGAACRRGHQTTSIVGDGDTQLTPEAK
jgi:hypothetical protein